MITVKWGHMGGALVQCNWCPYKKMKGHLRQVPYQGAKGVRKILLIKSALKNR